MGYGLGIFLAAIGLVLVYALEIDIPGVGDNTLGWILVLAGALIVVITAVQMNARRRTTSVATTTDAHGNAATTERRAETDGPGTGAV